MNANLIRKWNDTVNDDDIVYYLGDFALAKNPNVWKDKFNGNIIFIRGNHDKGLYGIADSKKIIYKGYKFWLNHYPTSIPKDWDGWVIHGHTHNNSKKYTFVNGDARTINVSCELVDYRPVDLDKIIALNIESIKKMDTIHSKPVRRNKMECNL